MSYEPSDFDLAAAIVRRAGDPEELLGYLATKLQAALPQQTQVSKGGLFGRGPVRQIDVALGEQRYTISLQRGTLSGQRARAVRGVVISHDDLTIDHWVRELTRELQQLAEQSERYADALRQLSLG